MHYWKRLSPLVLVLVGGCNEPANTPRFGASASAQGATGEASIAMPGTTCGGQSDCGEGLICVEERCRYAQTSVAGEILASSAESLAQAGDWEGAIEAYADAQAAYVAAHAPVPAEISCQHATLILSTATTTESREAGAHQADACFRASVPGFAPREEVRRAVARLRFQGLEVALFDQETAPERFFTQEQSPPTVDAVVATLEMPTEEQPNIGDLRAQLAADTAKHAVAECFIQDWEVRHEREARASLVMRYATRMRDMGDYDSYVPELTVSHTELNEDGFGPCVSRALTANLVAPRSGRVVAWQITLDVAARIN